MKETVFIKSDGTEASNFKLEDGDNFVFKNMKDYPSKFGRIYYVIDEQDRWIRMTTTQAKFFENFDIKPGTKIFTQEYSNKYGTFIGLTTKNGAEGTQKLPALKKQTSTTLSIDEETLIQQLSGNETYAEWKDFAKTSVTNFKDAIEGIATELGINNTLTGNKLDQAYQQFKTKL